MHPRLFFGAAILLGADAAAHLPFLPPTELPSPRPSPGLFGDAIDQDTLRPHLADPEWTSTVSKHHGDPAMRSYTQRFLAQLRNATIATRDSPTVHRLRDGPSTIGLLDLTDSTVVIVLSNEEIHVSYLERHPSSAQYSNRGNQPSAAEHPQARLVRPDETQIPHPSAADGATTAPQVILMTPYAPGTREHFKHPAHIRQLQDDLQGIVGGDSHAGPTVVGYTLDDEEEGYVSPTHGKVLISYNPIHHLEWCEEEKRDYIYSSVDIWTGDAARPVHSRVWRAPNQNQRPALERGGRPDEAEGRHAPMDLNRLNLNLQEEESLAYLT
ncbi:hypothetical protein P168DRAFT_292910 [Aspergillus campestris IBT 28561]|uniref:Uncharacterized protein n=1 Tax=Aspergillus campestris (strain IBT 28561) TaxID=1392248 RepID=A0A2I1CTQ6_ASPC2|nr:uncharacterized protein P168DRAFT_292910 [Aspergillus campestris IBT 28561]PKY00994.1 hypothetical protein P168DRAFT_292910 [Aspergillus campestris IBT 28561]